MASKLVSSTVAAVTISLLLFAPRNASAQDDPKGSIQSEEATAASDANADADAGAGRARHERAWYGKQTLIADGASLATFVLGALTGDTLGSILMGTGLAGYTLGAPAVHMHRGYVGRGFADAGMRVGLAAGVGLLGALAGLPAFDPAAGRDSKNAPDSKNALSDAFDPIVIGGATGIFVGAVIASAIDATVLAHENARSVGLHRLAPTAAISRTGATLGLGGTF